ncbi:MAG TPA: alpha/beta hydrolase-fold protein [Prolixibacteraceae bacterium]|nr:alpha/beta hydrolase-fold protein [Prolixibacteraceae bacterium]HQN93760.1 alpha/beta hydrolase-fold protein [Prolixibacteraceae bacterium]
MNKFKNLFLLVVPIALLFSCSGDPLAEVAEESDHLNVAYENVNSEVVGQNYTIYTYLPPNYQTSRDSLPVLYMLDADWEFMTVAKFAEKQISAKKMAPLIIVGIGYKGNSADKRNRDYTPTSVSEVTDREECCGAENFYQFIEKELISHIDSTCRTQGARYRAVAGHSLGGLFAFYCFFKHTETFTHYLAASPSVWWDNFVCFEYEEQFSKKASQFVYPTRLMMTLGQAGEGGGGIFPIMVEQLYERLTERDYSNFDTDYVVLNNTIHNENWEDAYQKALPYLFNAKN